MNALSFSDAAVIERRIEGAEVAVGFVGSTAEPLPLVEIVPKSGVFDYAARYTAGATEYFAPARVEPEIASAGIGAANSADPSILVPGEPPLTKSMVDDWTERKPSIVFECDDIEETYATIRDRGVHFTQPPKGMPWGPFAIFVDPDGNWFGLRGRQTSR